MVIPNHIERCRNEPKIVPTISLDGNADDKVLADENGYRHCDQQMYDQQAQTQTPPIGFQCQITKDHALETFGEDGDQIGGVGKHQQHEQKLSPMVLDNEKIKEGAEDGGEQRQIAGVHRTECGEETGENLEHAQEDESQDSS